MAAALSHVISTVANCVACHLRLHSRLPRPIELCPPAVHGSKSTCGLTGIQWMVTESEFKNTRLEFRPCRTTSCYMESARSSHALLRGV